MVTMGTSVPLVKCVNWGSWRALETCLGTKAAWSGRFAHSCSLPGTCWVLRLLLLPDSVGGLGRSRARVEMVQRGPASDLRVCPAGGFPGAGERP